MQNEQTKLIDPYEMRPHPILGRAGILIDLAEREERLGKGTGKARKAHKEAAEEMRGEFSALIDSVLQVGIREPLKVVRERGGWAIVDGRHRWEAAREILGIVPGEGKWADRQNELEARQDDLKAGLPCIEVAGADAPEIILDANLRRHLSKGAQAYLAVMVHPEVATDSKERQKKGEPSALSALGLATRIGVSLRLVKMAMDVYRSFEGSKTIRQKFEPGIWSGDGLGAILAGIAAYEADGATGDEAETEDQKRARQAKSWTITGLGYFQKVSRFWREAERLDADQKVEVAESAAQAIAAAPPDIREAIEAALAKTES